MRLGSREGGSWTGQTVGERQRDGTLSLPPGSLCPRLVPQALTVPLRYSPSSAMSHKQAWPVRHAHETGHLGSHHCSAAPDTRHPSY